MHNDLIISKPAVTTNDTELFLLLHGVGSNAEDLRSLGQALARHRPSAWVVSVQSPHLNEFANESRKGWQWFSVQGVTEANRPERVTAAMPAFIERIAAWQQLSEVNAERTTLIGFSQGSIMALESTQLAKTPRIASRVIAIAGRFAKSPHQAAQGVTLNLMHGEQDSVMPMRLAVEAERQLHALGVVATLDRFANLGHGIDARVVDAILHRLDESVRLPLWLHIGDEVLTVRNSREEVGQQLPLGAARIAREFFRHDPPTGLEIEQAIDVIENELMRLPPAYDAGRPLHSASQVLQPWATVSGSTISVETVEHWFESLSLAAQGRTSAMDKLPSGRKAAASLLLLRELMHHRGHPSIKVIKGVE